MPIVSESQRKWAWANKDKRTKEGKAAREFAKSDPGGRLPAKVKDGKPVKGANGLINRYGR